MFFVYNKSIINERDESMPQLVALTRERRSERWSQTDYFVMDDNIKNPEEALRIAIYTYLFTEDAKDMIDYTCGDFNWGDAITTVDEKVLKAFGIEHKSDHKQYQLSGPIVEIKVNQDEVLIEDEHLQKR